jgi:Fe-S cluster assembly protein SufD
MRQRGLPEAEARNLLTQAFLAEALDAAPEDAREALLEQLQAWLAA